MLKELLPRFVAHGIGGVQDLPVPTWLFYWGGAVVLVASFVALGALWKTPQFASRSTGREVTGGLSSFVLGPLRITAQFLAVLLFAVVLAAGQLPEPDESIGDRPPGTQRPPDVAEDEREQRQSNPEDDVDPRRREVLEAS